jgi:membrane protein implicated in regulation of membrane protease activity
VLALAEASDSDIPPEYNEQFIVTKIREALPPELVASIGSTEIKLDVSMGRGGVMNYNEQDNAIHINLSMLEVLFLNQLGKNITNQKLLVGFIKHELVHREFANKSNPIRYFIHTNLPCLEEILVSFSDIFRTITFNLSVTVQNGIIALIFGLLFVGGLAVILSGILPATGAITTISVGLSLGCFFVFVIYLLLFIQSFLKTQKSEISQDAQAPPSRAAQQVESEVTVKQVQEEQQVELEQERKTSVESTAEQSEPEIEPIPIMQEEKIDIDPKVEAFARLVGELPFELQRSFVRAVLGNDALTARFIRIITTSEERKWKRELSVEEISVTDITDAIKARFSLQQGTMRTTESGRIEFNLVEIQKSLARGRSEIISLTVKSMRELDHVGYIEAKDFKGFKNSLKAFIPQLVRIFGRTTNFYIWTLEMGKTANNNFCRSNEVQCRMGGHICNMDPSIRH